VLHHSPVPVLIVHADPPRRPETSEAESPGDEADDRGTVNASA
jgi:hypothetical protein